MDYIFSWERKLPKWWWRQWIWHLERLVKIFARELERGASQRWRSRLLRFQFRSRCWWRCRCESADYRRAERSRVQSSILLHWAHCCKFHRALHLPQDDSGEREVSPRETNVVSSVQIRLIVTASLRCVETSRIIIKILTFGYLCSFDFLAGQVDENAPVYANVGTRF